MMQLPPRLGTVESDLERQFQQAAGNSSAEGDPFFPNVKMRFANPSSGAAAQNQDQVRNILIGSVLHASTSSGKLRQGEPGFPNLE